MALRVLVDLVPVAVSAEPFALQAVVYFPHDIEWPIAHLARVPDNVVSGEVNSDTDEDCPTVRFRCPAGDGRDDCRHHQSYKSRRDKLHGTPHGVDGAIPHSLKIVSKYIGSSVDSSTEPMHRISAPYPGTYCTVADMARTWPRCGHSEVVLKREDAATMGKEVELAGSICWRSTDVRNQLLAHSSHEPGGSPRRGEKLADEIDQLFGAIGLRHVTIAAGTRAFSSSSLMANELTAIKVFAPFRVGP